MSGPNEARDPAEDEGTSTAPAPSAPPSFGKADPMTGDSGAPAPAGTAAQEDAGDTGSGDETEPAGSTPSDEDNRLPIGLQRPWWASADDDTEPDDPDEPGGQGPGAAGAEATAGAPPQAPEPAATSEAEDDGALVFGEPSPGPAPKEPEAPPAPPPGTRPGSLVAGRGVPKIDNRGDVGAARFVQPGGPSYADTDPDGIVVVDPDDAPGGESPESPESSASASVSAGSPEAPGAEEIAVTLDLTADTPQDEQPRNEQPRNEQPRDGGQGSGGDPGRTGEVPMVVTPKAFPPRGAIPPEEPPASPPQEPPASPPEEAPSSTTAPIAVAASTKGSALQADAGDGQGSDATGPTVITSANHAEGGLPIGTEPRLQPEPQLQPEPEPEPEDKGGLAGFGIGPLSSGAGTGAGAGRRRSLLIGGGVVAAIIVAIAGFAIANAGSDSEGRTAKAVGTPGSKTDPLPSPSPSAAVSAPPAPGGTGPAARIDDARTDGRPLALSEAFPAGRVDLDGRAYSRDRASVNHQCELAARGPLAQSLTRERCGSVVRVTFLDKERSLAVTSGIAVLPSKAAALKVNGAGDPSRYEWFRAMPGPRTEGIDRAGGYAASTVRGRYIAYAYATYADGKQPRPGDATLKSVAEQFVGYGLRPIDARARG